MLIEGKVGLGLGEQSTGKHFCGGSVGHLWHAYESAARKRQNTQFRHASKGQSGIEGNSASGDARREEGGMAHEHRRLGCTGVSGLGHGPRLHQRRHWAVVVDAEKGKGIYVYPTYRYVASGL